MRKSLLRNDFFVEVPTYLSDRNFRKNSGIEIAFVKTSIEFGAFKSGPC